MFLEFFSLCSGRVLCLNLLGSSNSLEYLFLPSDSSLVVWQTSKEQKRKPSSKGTTWWPQTGQHSPGDLEKLQNRTPDSWSTSIQGINSCMAVGAELLPLGEQCSCDLKKNSTPMWSCSSFCSLHRWSLLIFFPIRKADILKLYWQSFVPAKKEILPSGAMANMYVLFSSYYNNYSV